MKKTNTALLICFAALLSACSTTPISTRDAKLAPPDRIYKGGVALSRPLPNTGEVVIKRDSGISGSACSTRIYIDGVTVADIDTSEKVVLYLAEGDHILSAKPNGLCGGGLTEVKATVKTGGSSAFRYGSSGNGSPGLYPTAF